MNTTAAAHVIHAALAILAAARRANGDYRTTCRALARFCTEALADAAADLVVPARYHGGLPTWRTATRDEAIERLCAWANSDRVREWVVAFERSRQAAISELPAALEQLGAAL